MPKLVLDEKLMRTIEFVLSHEFSAADIAQHLTECHELDDAIDIAEYCIGVFQEHGEKEKRAFWMSVLQHLTKE